MERISENLCIKAFSLVLLQRILEIKWIISMKYFSTFTGIGGFDLWIQSAFTDAELVGYSEISKEKCKLFQHHFPWIKNYGDISKIIPEVLPNFDLLVGGPPCQSHSQAWNGKWFNDPRGQLFFDFINILKGKQPKAVIMENVPKLVTKNRWENLKIMLQAFLRAGYRPSYRILSADDFGIPQARKRLFIVGIRKDIKFRYFWPEPIKLEKTFKDFLDTGEEWDRSLFYKWPIVEKMSRIINEKAKNIRERFDMRYHHEAHENTTNTIVANIKKGEPCNMIVDRTLCKNGLWDCEFCGTSELEPEWCETCEDLCNFQTSEEGTPACRKFSFRELEKLFWFPKWYSDVPGITDYQKNEGFWNSVVVTIIAAIVSNLLPILA